jgi:hypothetical protein
MTLRRKTIIGHGSLCLGLLPALIAAMASCSGDSDQGESSAEPVPTAETPEEVVHRIRLFTGTGPATRELRVRPASGLWYSGAENVENADGNGSGLSPNATITLPDGTQVEESENQGEPEAWLLVRAAMLSCGSGPLDDLPFPGDIPSTFYFMKHMLNYELQPTCDKLLHAQQVLLCAGDKLAQVSEARGPIVWNVPDAVASGMQEGPYTIPPTAERNAFIARDLAVHTLAHVAWLDLLRVNAGLNGVQTCTELYGHVQQDPEWGVSMRHVLFEVNPSGFLPAEADTDLPLPVTEVQTTIDAQTLAANRLAFKAHVLRATSRLLPDLISAGVYADLAGAARRRSREGDLGRGQAVLWGTRGPEGGYNSLAHAARVVGQRWQTGHYELKPWLDLSLTTACSSIAPGDALDEAYGDDKDARSGSLPPISAGQRDAIASLESTGIVFSFAFETEPDQRKEMILDQLLFAGAVAAGMEPTLQSVEDFRLTPAGQSILAKFDGVSDEDFRFAVATLRDRYRVLTQTSALLGIDAQLTATVNAPESTLHPTHKSFFQNYANVFNGPMPKTDLDNDVMAKVGGLQNVSQCSESGDFGVTLGIDDAWDLSMQDGFAAGQALYGRLVAIRETDSSEAQRVAASAAAEARAWSGEGRILVRGVVRDLTDPSASQIELTTLGFEPEDFGVETESEMESQLALVWGRAIHADCAAGLTVACPLDVSERMAPLISADVRSFSNEQIPTYDPAQEMMVDQPPEVARRHYGADGTWGRFMFAAGDRFAATFSGSGKPEERIYVVQLRDPASLQGKGKVLGAVTLRRADEVSTVVVSSRQRKMYNDIFGINRKGLMSDNPVGKRSLAEGNAYCLEGVPYDTFVPLENELTSDGDQFESSWKYVLNLAKQASFRADELGDKLLDWGLQKELRREQANENIGEICGAYGQIDNVKIEDGKPVAGDTDGPLDSCLDTEKFDVVFLGNEPPELHGKTGAELTSALKTLLDCPPEGGSASQLCNKDEITHAAMGLEGVDPFENEEDDTCDDVIGAAVSLGSYFEGSRLVDLSQEAWRHPDRLRSVAGSLRMASWFADPPGDDELHWQVTVGGVSRIMDSHDDSMWPGCHRTPQCDYTGASPLHSTFDRLFKVAQNEPLTAQQMERLRWQVEGALWTLAGMGGVVPDGMFSFPAPVANFTEVPDAEALSPAAIYGPGYLEELSGKFYLHVGGSVSEKASSKLGTPSRIPSNWAPHGTDAAGPQWLRDFWQHARFMNQEYDTAYLAVSADNDELVLDSHEKLAEELQAAADAFTGMECSSPFFQGNPMPAPAAGAESGRAVVEKLKLGGNWSEVCNRPAAAKGGYFSMARTGGSVDTTQLDVAFFQMLWSNMPEFDVLLCPAGCASVYGTWGQLAPVGAPQPPQSVLGRWAVPVESNYCHPGGARLDDAGSTFQPGVTALCVKSEFKGSMPTGDVPNNGYGVGEYILSPDECGKEKRVRMFVNGHAPPTACDAASQLVQALGIACELQHIPLPVNMDGPPDIGGVEDIGAVGIWVQSLGTQAGEAAGRLYVESIPRSVLADDAGGNVGLGNNAGSVGITRLELGKDLRAVRTHWRHVGETLAQIGRDMHDAQLAIQAAGLVLESSEINIAIERINSWASAAEASARAAGGFSPGVNWLNPGDAVAGVVVAAIELIRAEAVAEQLDRLGDVNNEQYENSKARVFNDLSSTVALRFSTIADSLTALQDAVASAKQNASALESMNAKTEYELAKGSGEDFAMVGGQVVQFPVNTVLNRQYDVTKRRYEKALAEARYLSFMARLAIEQRIGEKLDSVSFPGSVGPVESPAGWADDVCSMTGIDFDKYKDAPLPEWAKETDADAGVPLPVTPQPIQLPSSLLQPQFQRNLLGLFNQEGIIDDLSKQYIGDYITRLENFVMYYNTEFPSHEGDDTAVLSLRDDLLRDTTPCTTESANLLYYSGQLGENDAIDSGGETFTRGWQIRSCDPALARCLRAVDGSGLGGDSSAVAYDQPPSAIPGARVSFLTESALVEMDAPPGGWPATSEEPPPVEEVVPPRTVYQQLELEPGSYVLSWWDSARDEDGRELPDPTAAPTLFVSVNGPADATVASSLDTAFAGEIGVPTQLWGERRSLGFEVTEAGIHTIGISVWQTPQEGGHVAIAGLQLEAADSVGAAPSSYTENAATRLHVSSVCPEQGAEAVQAGFSYECESSGRCFYEISSPFVIDTSNLDPNYLNGKLAEGNFNFRHVTLAVNLIGSGVIDCAENPTTSCYANATIDYTLSHEATNVDVTGWNGTTRAFNFGEAFINDGKALAGERVITVPIGSADQGLLQQEGITKGEFMGRPLDGVYRLRIWDRPGLVWSRLEDVQLVFKYRYWSAIRNKPASP